ncbi:hypothetical protein HNQ77_004570 [Silvibacterium bohemicum]|uniref:O-antigen polymerase n=1 Tax=Silvibacterium bohemicum TaxID=1577686 RepID=A0A841K628_9BACT|nr:hypothetical protein [Silvibacterium bohemicum]MBB6146591.1 hypothetical protein [Silvibacterium bohemicum]
MKVASFFYALALLTLPVGPATKLLLGREEMVWLDPTLIFGVLAFAALIPAWRAEHSRQLPQVAPILSGLALICIACALSGYLLRLPENLYGALREPLKFFLMIIWFVTSCWFLRFRSSLVFRWASVAAVLGILSGLSIYFMAAGLLPVSAGAVSYSRLYILRQSIWFDFTPIPRMGGLFIEAPPFGLTMLALWVLFCVALRSGVRTKATLIGAGFSLIGALASLSDQVTVGLAICATASVLSITTRPRWMKRAVLSFTVVVFIGVCVLSLQSKLTAAADAQTAVNIYRNSVGERTFHLNYGLSVLRREPSAALFGIGPGRYGEYVAETGLFPAETTMQYTGPELLVEWGVAGVAVWLLAIVLLSDQVWKLHAMGGLGMLIGLLISDSFQANWKLEAVFLAIAALCTSQLASSKNGKAAVSKAFSPPPLPPAGKGKKPLPSGWTAGEVPST